MHVSALMNDYNNDIEDPDNNNKIGLSGFPVHKLKSYAQKDFTNV